MFPVGIDVSKYTLDLCMLYDGMKGRVKTRNIRNDRSAVAHRLRWLRLQHCGPEDVHVVMEATGVYHERLTAAVAKDETQIHTHMCYCEFNDIMASIAALDADVITIETSRSDMELLDAFNAFEYPNEIGPGVYDIHSPNVPDVEWIENLLRKAAQRIPEERLWVNPDCGLKTRSWRETRQALANMVKAARNLRGETA